MEILIVSGFLGAGKTTFIKRMTQATGRSFVIYENEYGQSAVDTKILENENLSVWESTENCVCCTGKGDFTQSLITISATLDPDYLIVEPTGVAKLRSILENIKQTGYERISVLAPVAIVDCVNWKQQRNTARDIWEDQILGAESVILSKISKASGDLETLKKTIRELNPKATIVEEEFDSLDSSFFTSLLGKAESNKKIQDSSSETASKLVQLSMQNAQLSTVSHLIYILDLAVMGAFGKVTRAKGFLECGQKDEWIKFDLVEREWAITGMEKPTDDTKPVAVFIGENLQKKVLHELFSIEDSFDNAFNEPISLRKLSGVMPKLS